MSTYIQTPLISKIILSLGFMLALVGAFLFPFRASAADATDRREMEIVYPATSTDLSGSCPGGVGNPTELITAINNANADTVADTITLAAGCVYTLTSVYEADPDGFGPTGLPAIQSSITINGNGATLTRDNSVSRLRFFYVAPSGDLTLDSLIVQNGRIQGFQGARAGSDGGGNGGSSAGLGGAIFNRGALTIQKSAFLDNQTLGANGLTGGSGNFSRGVGGGGIGSAGTQDKGGGVNGGNSASESSATSDGQSGGVGGGGGGGSKGGGHGGNGGFGGGGGGGGAGSNHPIYGVGGGGFGGGGGGGGNAHFNLSAGGAGGFGGGKGGNLRGHGGASAGMGGAIFNYGGVITLTNSTFADNLAQGGNGSTTTTQGSGGGSGYGGAVFNYEGTIVVNNSSLVGNMVTAGGGRIVGQAGGGAVYNYGSAATLTLRNSLLADSVGGSDCFRNSGTVNVNTATLIEDGSCSATLTGDPQLGPLGDYGGETPTIPLLSNSPAIDAGDNATCEATDQRGVSRPLNGVCDIGAYEGAVVIEVGLVKTVNPGSALPGDTITYTLVFSSHSDITTAGAVITDSVPAELSNVTYQAVGDTGVTLSRTDGITYEWTTSALEPGQGGIITIIGQLDTGLALGQTVANTATISVANDSDLTNNSGSAVVQISCTDSYVVTNANDNGVGSLRFAIAIICPGGAITFADSYSIYLNSVLSINKKLTIDGAGFDVTISGDSGNDGSRNVQVFNIGSSGVVTLSYLSVVSGTATNGGGINNSGALTVQNSLFEDNQANQYGGAIRSDGGSVIITETIFTNNSTNTSDGGGIYMDTDR